MKQSILFNNSIVIVENINFINKVPEQVLYEGKYQFCVEIYFTNSNFIKAYYPTDDEATEAFYKIYLELNR